MRGEWWFRGEDREFLEGQTRISRICTFCRAFYGRKHRKKI